MTPKCWESVAAQWHFVGVLLHESLLPQPQPCHFAYVVAFAREHVATVTQPHLIRLRRMLIGEAERFPELARAWHRAAPERGHAVLAAAIERLTARGLLSAADPLLAAQHLNYLILSIPLNEAMFAVRETFDEAELQRWADEAVHVFLAAYGSLQGGSPDA